jgi:hypothetical protein
MGGVPIRNAAEYQTSILKISVLRMPLQTRFGIEITREFRFGKIGFSVWPKAITKVGNLRSPPPPARQGERVNRGRSQKRARGVTAEFAAKL